MEALQLIGRHLGMWNDKIKVGGDAENPLFALIQEAHSTPPIVRGDPERRKKPDVQDVEPRAAKGTAPGAVLQRKTCPQPTGWRPA